MRLADDSRAKGRRGRGRGGGRKGKETWRQGERDKETRGRGHADKGKRTRGKTCVGRRGSCRAQLRAKCGTGAGHDSAEGERRT